jgi:hypothetical protein
MKTVDLDVMLEDLYGRKFGVGSQRASWRGDNNNSFNLFVGEEGYVVGYDFALGKTYNSYTFLKEIEKYNDEQIREYLSKDFPKSNHRGVIQDKTAVEGIQDEMFEKNIIYSLPLENRGFQKGEQLEYRISTNGDELSFEVFNGNGMFLGYKRRLSKGKIRYLQNFNSGSYPWIRRGKTDIAFIIEGEFNAMIAHATYCTSEKHTVLGLAGHSSINNLPLHLLHRKHIYIYLDDSDSRKDLIDKLAKILRSTALTINVLPLLDDEDDFCDLAVRSRKQLKATINVMVENSINILTNKFMVDTIPLDDLRFNRYEKQKVGIPTGFSSIDKFTLGLPENEMIVIGALSTVGKSTFVHEILLHNIDEGKKVAIFSPDYGVKPLVRNLSGKISGVGYRDLVNRAYDPIYYKRFGDLSGMFKAYEDGNRKILEYIQEDNLYINSSLSKLDEIRQTYETLIDRGYSIFIFDYLHFFAFSLGGYGTGTVATTSNFFKTLATRGGTIICTAQLNKSNFGTNRGSDPLPNGFDLKDSSQIYQDAFQIFVLYDWLRHEHFFNDGYPRLYGREQIDLADNLMVILTKDKDGVSEAKFFLEKDLRINKFHDR